MAKRRTDRIDDLQILFTGELMSIEHVSYDKELKKFKKGAYQPHGLLRFHFCMAIEASCYTPSPSYQRQPHGHYISCHKMCCTKTVSNSMANTTSTYSYRSVG